MKGEDDGIGSLTHQRIGVHSLNNKGNGATCIEYNNAFDITIKFDNSEIVNTLHWNDFIIGKFKSPFDKNADGGYLGNVFKTKEDLNRKIYCTWKDMLKRVNTINRTNRNKTYKDVSTTALFLSQKRNRISDDMVANLLKKYTGGINKHITPHKLRSTTATNLIKSGTPVTTVAKILGHDSIQTTMGYVGALNEETEKAIQNLDNVF